MDRAGMVRRGAEAAWRVDWPGAEWTFAALSAEDREWYEEVAEAVLVDAGALPLGGYTRTAPDPDDMDGGVAAALVEKEAETRDVAHDIDWQVVAEQHEAALAAMTEDRDRVLDLVRDADMGRDLAVERAEKAERERDAAVAAHDEARPLTAREHLDAAWEAAHVPEDGVIPAETDYMVRLSPGTYGVRGSGPEPIGAEGAFTRRLLDPPEPARAADQLRALLDAYDGQDPDSLAYEDSLPVFLARHGARVEGDR